MLDQMLIPVSAPTSGNSYDETILNCLLACAAATTTTNKSGQKEKQQMTTKLSHHLIATITFILLKICLFQSYEYTQSLVCRRVLFFIPVSKTTYSAFPHFSPAISVHLDFPGSYVRIKSKGLLITLISHHQHLS